MVANLHGLLQGSYHGQPGVRRDLNIAAVYRFHFNVIFSNLMSRRTCGTAAGHHRASQTFTGDRNDDFLKSAGWGRYKRLPP